MKFPARGVGQEKSGLREISKRKHQSAETGSTRKLAAGWGKKKAGKAGASIIEKIPEKNSFQKQGVVQIELESVNNVSTWGYDHENFFALSMGGEGGEEPHFKGKPCEGEQCINHHKWGGLGKEQGSGGRKGEVTETALESTRKTHTKGKGVAIVPDDGP